MIFEQSAMSAILFFKKGAKCSQVKHVQAKTSYGVFLHSEAVGPIRRDKSGELSMLTPFGFEARVKGQIQHL